MKKKILDLMKTEFLKNLSLADLELLEGEEGEIKKRDANGIETGDIEHFAKILVEVKKGNGSLSRLQIPVKIPNGKLKFKSEEIENGTQSYLVYFKDLEISFIDSKGNAYFRAKDYEIEEDKNDDFK